MVLMGDADKTHLLGGTIEVLPQPKDPRFGKYVLTPREVRKLLAEKGWERVVAFQTRNPLHRAHEYALVYGLETLLRAGHNAGACLNPLIGETKGDDVDADVRMHTYEVLIQNRALGDGDSDPALWGPRGESVPDRVILLGLDIKMFYGGPKEAVMHGIYRQNFGFTDIIIGRKHADAPYHDGKPIWGDFDAQEIFNNLKGDLKIHPLLVGFAAYYESVGRVDLMDNHKDEKPVFISGKDVRKAPARRPPGRSADHAREHGGDSDGGDGEEVRNKFARLHAMNHTNLQFVYRNVGIEGIDEIRPLWEQLNAYHVQLSPHFADEVGRRTFEPRRLEIQAKAETGKVRIELAAAGSDGTDVAYCIATVSADEVAEVDSIFVKARFRGCGIGTELMQGDFGMVSRRGSNLDRRLGHARQR